MSTITVAAQMSSVRDAVPGSVRRVANNTVRYSRNDGATVWRLHTTDIVIRHADQSWTLNSGGWRTVTTKDRINAYGPARVYSSKGEWRVNGSAAFMDGIRLNPLGAVETPASQTERASMQAVTLRKRINKFVAKLDSGVPESDTGDCFICRFSQTAGNSNRGAIRRMPSVRDMSDCLHAHLQEGYMHSSLIRRAGIWVGRPVYNDWPMTEIVRVMGVNTVKRDMRRFLCVSFGLSA